MVISILGFLLLMSFICNVIQYFIFSETIEQNKKLRKDFDESQKEMKLHRMESQKFKWLYNDERKLNKNLITNGRGRK